MAFPKYVKLEMKESEIDWLLTILEDPHNNPADEASQAARSGVIGELFLAVPAAHYQHPTLGND